MPDVSHVAAGGLLRGWPKPAEQGGQFPAESGGQNPWNQVAITRGIRTFARGVRRLGLRPHCEPCRVEGPYRFVRHPGYAGAILESIGSPLLLGSVWALLPAATAVACMAARTLLEDRMLLAELPGYAEYASEVRQRLVPLAW